MLVSYKYTLFYKNTLYKNIEASFKLITKTNLGYRKKYFKHMIEGGSWLKMCQTLCSKVKNIDVQPITTCSYKIRV